MLRLRAYAFGLLKLVAVRMVCLTCRLIGHDTMSFLHVDNRSSPTFVV